MPKNELDILKSGKFLSTGIIIALLALCLLNYGASLKNDFLLDDFNFLSKKYNYTFRSFPDFFTKSESQHYLPIYYLINQSLFQTFPVNPLPLRSINLLLFSLDCLLLYVLLIFLTENRLASLLATILFCLHPIQSDSVNYITNNYVFLFSIFMKSSLIFFWMSLRKGRGSLSLHGLSLFFYAAGLFTFEGALLYPLYLASGLYFLRGDKLKQITTKCLPYLLMAFLYLIAWVLVAGKNTGIQEKAISLGLSPLSYLSTITYLIGWYIENLFVPRQIVYIKNIQPVLHQAWIGGSIFVCVLGLIVFLFSKHWRRGVKPFALFWFAIGFLLVLPASFAHSYMGLVIEPHWLYFSSIGFFLLTAVLLLEIKQKITPWLWRLLLATILLVFFCYTQQYNDIARSEERYCRFWSTQSPQNPIPLFRLGVLAKNPRDALAYFQETLRYGNYQRDKTYANIALIFLRQNDIRAAEQNVLHSLEINPKNPMAHNLLGTIFVEKNSFAAAEKEFLKACELKPPSSLAFLNLIDLYILTKQEPKALALYPRAADFSWEPSSHQILLARFSALFYKNGYINEAQNLLEKIIKEDPSPKSFLLLTSTFSAMGMETLALEIRKSCLALHSQKVNACYPPAP